jgi:hypothetical protein
MSEVQIIDRQISAIKDSAPYRRLITSARGPREDQELKRLNLQIETLEHRKTESLAKNKPPAIGRHTSLKPPTTSAKVSTTGVTKSVVREEPKVVSTRKVLTFAAKRPVGITQPRGGQTKVLTPAAAHMPAGHGIKNPPPDADLDSLDDPPVPAPISQALKKGVDRPRLRPSRHTKAPQKVNVAVLRDNIHDLEANLEDLTEEI